MHGHPCSARIAVCTCIYMYTYLYVPYTLCKQFCACHLEWYLHLFTLSICSASTCQFVLANTFRVLLIRGWSLTGRNSKLTGYMTDQWVKFVTLQTHPAGSGLFRP